jgi:hypothetical protein
MIGVFARETILFSGSDVPCQKYWHFYLVALLKRISVFALWRCKSIIAARCGMFYSSVLLLVCSLLWNLLLCLSELHLALIDSWLWQVCGHLVSNRYIAFFSFEIGKLNFHQELKNTRKIVELVPCGRSFRAPLSVNQFLVVAVL